MVANTINGEAEEQDDKVDESEVPSDRTSGHPRQLRTRKRPPGSPAQSADNPHAANQISLKRF
jgi:hypothetical protein